MNVIQRRATSAFALMLGLSAPAALAAQANRAVGPNPDTPRLLVAVFASPDRTSGVLAADAIHTRVQTASNIKTLYVIPKNDITNYLESSGYKADSSLGPTDLKELAKLLRADEVLSGTVSRTAAGGVKIEPRLMLARDVALAQPLPTAEANNAGDAARQIEKSLQDARKQLADNKACENAIRDSKNDLAVANARAGIAKYPNATIARLCLANAFIAMKAPPDSVLKVTDEIRRLDPKNSQALRFAFTAYQAKNDNENAVRALVRLLELEPGNSSLQATVIAELAKLGKPEIALPIIRELLAQNPGDPQLLRQAWLLTLADAAGADSASRSVKFASAIAAGDEMAKADTILADSVYFERQIIAGNQVVPPRGLEFASRAVQKFPNSAGFWASKANAERKAGQSQMAIESMKRALYLNPKTPNGNLMLAQIYLDLNQPDSAVAVTRRAVLSGEDAKTWGAFLLGPTQAAFKQAQESKNPADYERALALATESDALSPSATAKFFKGVSAFSIGIDALQQAQKPKSCTLARKAQQMFLETMTNMPAGGSVDANVAKQILGYVGQYSPAADQMVKQYCK